MARADLCRVEDMARADLCRVEDMACADLCRVEEEKECLKGDVHASVSGVRTSQNLVLC